MMRIEKRTTKRKRMKGFLHLSASLTSFRASFRRPDFCFAPTATLPASAA